MEFSQIPQNLSYRIVSFAVFFVGNTSLSVFYSKCFDINYQVKQIESSLPLVMSGCLSIKVITSGALLLLISIYFPSLSGQNSLVLVYYLRFLQQALSD